MASQSNAVTLKRGGRSHDMQPQQVTMENLRRVFKVCNSDKVLKYNSLLRSFHNFTQVDPSEAWLQDECDGTAYFPQEGRQFNLHSLGLAPYATSLNALRLLLQCHPHKQVIYHHQLVYALTSSSIVSFGDSSEESG